jgi:hypothetical protein
MAVMYVDKWHTTVLDLVRPGVKSRLCKSGCIEIPGSDLVK